MESLEYRRRKMRHHAWASSPLIAPTSISELTCSWKACPKSRGCKGQQPWKVATGPGVTHLGQARPVGPLGLDVGHIFVEVLEFLHGWAERHDLTAWVLGPMVLRPHGCGGGMTTPVRRQRRSAPPPPAGPLPPHRGPKASHPRTEAVQLNGAQGSQGCFISSTKDQMTSISYRQSWPCPKSP